MAEEILISYRVEIDQLKAELKQVQTQLKATETTGKEAANKTSKEFNKAGTEIKQTLTSIAGAIGVAFGVAQVISFGKESIKAFAEAEVNANKLKFAVTQIGKEGSAAYQKLIDQSNKLQDISIFSDDDIQKAQTQLATLGLNSKQIEELIPKVLDLASATGQELGGATDSIIQGINGQTRGLKAVGLEFEATGDKTKNLAILTENLNKFQGSTAAALETTAGKAKRLENAFDNLKENIGEFLVTAGNDFLDAFDIISGKKSAGEVGSGKVFDLIQKGFDKSNQNILKKAGESENERVNQIAQSEERIRALKTESLNKTKAEDINAISFRLKNEIKLQQELAKVNQEGEGLKAQVDTEAAAKALELAKKNAIELRDLQASLIADEKSKELAELVNKFTDIKAAHVGQVEYLLALETSYQQQRDAIIKKFDDKEKADNEALFQEAIKVAEASSDAEAAIDKKAYDERKKLREKEEDEEKGRRKKREEESIAFAQQSLDSIASIASNIQQSRLNEAQEISDKEKAILDSQLKSGVISRTEYDKKISELEEKKRKQEAEIRKKQFEQDKAISLIKIAISTAQGIANALEGDPYTVAYRVAFAALVGATQAAVVASQPTPKFAKGGKVDGRLHSQGGTLIEAEKDEWIIKRNESIKNDSLLDAINKGKGQKYIYEMYVAPALKEQLKKHNTSKDSDFASSIASSMMLNSGQFKDGNIIESLKMQRRADKENIDRLITVLSKNNTNIRNIV